MDRRLIALLDSLNGDADETTAAANSFFEEAGFSTVVWAEVDRSTRTPRALVSNIPVEWTDQYFAEGYIEHDPWFGAVMRGESLLKYNFENRDAIFPNRSAKTESLLGEMRDMGHRTSHFVGCSHEGQIFSGYNLWSGATQREIDEGLSDWRRTFEVGTAMADLAMSGLAETGLVERYGVYPNPVDRVGEALSPREIEVLQFLASGLRNDRIGEKMGISLPTVRFHFQNIRRKLGAKTREQALALALKGQLLQL